MNALPLQLSSKARDALLRAGWGDGRFVDSGKIFARLEELGFRLFPEAKQILENFGGLQVKFNGVSNWLYFDPIRPAKAFSPTGIARLAKIVGEPVCTLGMMPLADVLVSESGRIIVLGVGWHELSIIENLSDYVNSMAIPSTAGWRTRELPEQQRPSFVSEFLR